MAKQLVIFELAGGYYGVDIFTVDRVIQWQPIAPVPRAPGFVEGVTHLEDAVLPVIDLRKRLGLPARETTPETRIIVAKTGSVPVGMLVDAAHKILQVEEAAIIPPPPIVKGANAEFITHIVKTEAKEPLVILLDLDRVLSKKEKVALQKLDETLDEAQPLQEQERHGTT